MEFTYHIKITTRIAETKNTISIDQPTNPIKLENFPYVIHISKFYDPYFYMQSPCEEITLKSTFSKYKFSIRKL
ncbi:Uncharacterized protein FWK35_00034737 [Aphis craccivora]|uniref:Uncharacterized protein n=1 Tax=Aphis craccivora TaxID=307492 RepID=A0A6G0ZEW6_APHCR|nr:Uncharacterized protein FWK35_00034737 [Aphis craccivora]